MIVKEFKFTAILSNKVKVVAETYEKCREAADIMVEWFGGEYTIIGEYDNIAE